MDKFQSSCSQRLHEVEKIIDMANQDILTSPQGSLHIAHSGKTEQYYHKSTIPGSPRKYIRKSEQVQVRQLAQKEYAQRVLAQAEHDKRKLEKAAGIAERADYIQFHEKMNEGKRKFVKPYFFRDEDYIEKWENEKRIIKLNTSQCPVELAIEENAIITEKGEIVRSKSEKILADKLNISEVPYVYEFPLLLEGYGCIYPDFTVLNTRTREEYYWEHFGLMDNEKYCEKAIMKIETYQRNGIYPGKGLIITYETTTHPLHTKIVKGIIEQYLM